MKEPRSTEHELPALTVNDVRRRAEEVRGLATAEIRRVARIEPARFAGYALIAAAVVISLAYYAGTRRCSCDAGE